MSISLRTTQQHPGGNHGGIIYRDVNSVELGTAYWDPARSQFAFQPNDQGLVLSSADQTAILAILNGLSK